MDDYTGKGFPYLSFEELIEKASKQAEGAPEDLQRTVFLYYLSRYHLLLFEDDFSATPFQVANEYRNGLDHLMRYLSGYDDISSDDQHQNLRKIEKHMQNALFRACEHHVHSTVRWAEKFEKNHGGEVILSLVSNGEFMQEWQKKKQSAHSAFTRASKADSLLGENSLTDDDIVKQYLSATYAYHQLMQYSEKHREDIAKAVIQHETIAKKAGNLSVAKQAGIGIIVAIIVAIIGTIINAFFF